MLDHRPNGRVGPARAIYVDVSNDTSANYTDMPTICFYSISLVINKEAND